MSSPSEAPAPAHPSMVLGAYLEPLVRGKRIAVLGDATLDLAEALAERGARLVHSFDPNPARVAEALARRSGGPRNVTHAVFGDELGVRDGAFDVGVVPDLALFADPADLVRRAKRLVGSGALVVVSPNGAVSQRLVDAPHGTRSTSTYYELFDLLALQFPRVRMAGQAPFVGYAVADFAPDGEPEVSFDASLLDGSEEPEFFVAVGSERPLELDSFAVVELPFASLAAARPVAIAPSKGELHERQLALTEAQARLALVTVELEAMRERARGDAREREHRNAALAARVAELDAEIAKNAARGRELETKAGDEHVRAERLTHSLRELEEELRRQRERGVALTKQLDEEKRARTKAEVELGMLRGRAEAARERGDEARTDASDQTPTQPRGSAGHEAIRAEKERIAELEAAAEEAGRQNMQLAHLRGVAEGKVTALALELDAARQARAAAETVTAQLEARIAEARGAMEVDRARAEALEKRLTAAHASSDTSADVAMLEARLRERGYTIAGLERDVRESERIGRELVETLMEKSNGVAVHEPVPDAPIAAAAAAPSPAIAHDDLRGRLDVLATSAARAEADLQAALWRVAQLEREIEDTSQGPRSMTIVQRELEDALYAAREEIAELKRRSPTDPS